MLGRVGKLLIKDYHAAILKPSQMKNPYIELLPEQHRQLLILAGGMLEAKS